MRRLVLVSIVFSLVQLKCCAMERLKRCYHLQDVLSKSFSDKFVQTQYGERKSDLESALDDAHPMIKNIIYHLLCPGYLKTPGFRSCLFVGPPGVGKTLTSKAIAYKLGWNLEFMGATELLGGYRNQTSIALQKRFDKIIETYPKKGLGVVVVIDELDRILQNYESEHHDSDTTSATLWGFLDRAVRWPKFFLIGTMNRADKLPPQLQNRHTARIVLFSVKLDDSCAQASSNTPIPAERLLQLFTRALEKRGITRADNVSNDEIVRLIGGGVIRDLMSLVERCLFIIREEDQGDEITLTLPIFQRACKENAQINYQVFKVHEREETTKEQSERHHKERVALTERQWVQSQLITIFLQTADRKGESYSRSANNSFSPFGIFGIGKSESVSDSVTSVADVDLGNGISLPMRQFLLQCCFTEYQSAIARELLEENLRMLAQAQQPAIEGGLSRAQKLKRRFEEEDALRRRIMKADLEEDKFVLAMKLFLLEFTPL